MHILTEPDCPTFQGYSLEKVKDMLGADAFRVFDAWIAGHTLGYCDGWEYDPFTGEKKPSRCGLNNAHGSVVDEHNLGQFMDYI